MFFKNFDIVFKNSTRDSKDIAYKYFEGLFRSKKKNCVCMSESLDGCNSQQLNHFINEGKWNYAQLEDLIANFFYDMLSDHEMIDDCCLLVDESSFPKKGEKFRRCKKAILWTIG